jgi:hypothetical protein
VWGHFTDESAQAGDNQRRRIHAVRIAPPHASPGVVSTWDACAGSLWWLRFA